MSDHVIYVDESGDHGLKTIDPDYPVFVLVFCIFEQQTYIEAITPAVQAFKFKHFGHDMAILHERDIRKQIPPFDFLRGRQEVRDAFFSDLTRVIEEAPFTIVAAIVDKNRLRGRYKSPASPYDLSLAFALERAAMHLEDLTTSETHVVIESRGRVEDDQLELEFRRVCDGANMLGNRLPFKPVFASKKTNSTGLQLADLVARPIGLSVMRPTQPNRTYDIIQKKLRQSPSGNAQGWGLKIFP